MKTRHSLIETALRQRYAAVREGVERLVPGDFGDMKEFVASTRQLVLDRSRARGYTSWSLPAVWFHCDSNCLISLRRLALEEALGETESDLPPDFDRTVRAAAHNPKQRYQLLIDRYAHPLNFSAPSESLVREYVLERLMVQDRASIERQRLASVNMDDLLLRLNLTGIHASATSDLRFIDALNYYFELLSSTAIPSFARNWLCVSFLALYARALSVRRQEIAACA